MLESQIDVLVMTTIHGLSIPTVLGPTPKLLDLHPVARLDIDSSISDDMRPWKSPEAHSYPGNRVSKSIGCHSVSSAISQVTDT